MVLGIRKLIVLGLACGIFLMANAIMVANWLADKGVIDFAKHIRAEFLTGTAITILVALLILLVGNKDTRSGLLRRCPVCDHALLRGKYCAECGSKV